MKATKFSRTLTAIVLSTLMTLTLIHVSAQPLKEKEHYLKADVTYFFTDERHAVLRINFSWYGVWAQNMARLLERMGEENYTNQFLRRVSEVIGNGTFIGGDLRFYAKSMDAEVKRFEEGNATQRVDLVFTAELEAKEGRIIESGGRKGIVYSTRSDYSNVTKLYVEEMDLLNVTVVLPKGYVVSLVRPIPNVIFRTNVNGEERVAVQWALENPTVDTREVGYTGWFFLGVVTLTDEEIKILGEVKDKVRQLVEGGVLLSKDDTSKAAELFYLYNLFSTRSPKEVQEETGKDLKYLLNLARSVNPLPLSPEVLALLVSALLVVVEVSAYLMYVKRKT